MSKNRIGWGVVLIIIGLVMYFGVKGYIGSLSFRDLMHTNVTNFKLLLGCLTFSPWIASFGAGILLCGLIDLHYSQINESSSSEEKKKTGFFRQETDINHLLRKD